MQTLTSTKKYNAVILPVPIDGKVAPTVLDNLPETQQQYIRLINSERLFIGKVFTCFEYGYHFLLLPYAEDIDLIRDIKAGVGFIDTMLSDSFGAYYLHAETTVVDEQADEVLTETFKSQYRGTITWRKPKTKAS